MYNNVQHSTYIDIGKRSINNVVNIKAIVCIGWSCDPTVIGTFMHGNTLICSKMCTDVNTHNNIR